ncbi:hypothetical protein SDC9_198737 [bioreactor metagenome]|uniref:Uncharacterized protein n=1 Tax=bioreactor metagenome TaxID=1076179 RepID=A0A645IIH8_9ZZZZ
MYDFALFYEDRDLDYRPGFNGCSLCYVRRGIALHTRLRLDHLKIHEVWRLHQEGGAFEELYRSHIVFPEIEDRVLDLFFH